MLRQRQNVGFGGIFQLFDNDLSAGLVGRLGVAHGENFEFHSAGSQMKYSALVDQVQVRTINTHRNNDTVKGD